MKNQTYTLSSGPKLALVFLLTETGALKIHITESPSFTFSFFVDLPPLLKEDLLAWQVAYSNKEPLALLNLPGQILPPFSKKVLRSLEEIPFGKTLSYGEIALLSGSPKASRAVGTICRLNAWPLFIPCHRVVPQKGNIGTYAFGYSIKKELLEFEGAI